MNETNENFEFHGLTPELKQDVMERISWGVSIEEIYDYRLELYDTLDNIKEIEEMPEALRTRSVKREQIKKLNELAKNLASEADSFRCYTKGFKQYLKTNFNNAIELIKKDVESEIAWANREVLAYRAYEEDVFQQEFNEIYPDYAQPTVTLPSEYKQGSKRGIKEGNSFEADDLEMQ